MHFTYTKLPLLLKLLLRSPSQPYVLLQCTLSPTITVYGHGYRIHWILQQQSRVHLELRDTGESLRVDFPTICCMHNPDCRRYQMPLFTESHGAWQRVGQWLCATGQFQLSLSAKAVCILPTLHSEDGCYLQPSPDSSLFLALTCMFFTGIYRVLWKGKTSVYFQIWSVALHV